ncbi:hypothetical protein Bbelb_237870 [Branchiostoma belcheri]|nr:hypothetical protein Bbelb_237870 [Branchiostoma belcheri]
MTTLDHGLGQTDLQGQRSLSFIDTRCDTTCVQVLPPTVTVCQPLSHSTTSKLVRDADTGHDQFSHNNCSLSLITLATRSVYRHGKFQGPVSARKRPQIRHDEDPSADRHG